MKKGKAYGNRSTDSNFFETPYSMTEQLFEVEKFNFRKTVLEPAAGNGAITEILEDKFSYFKINSYDITPQNHFVNIGDFYKEDRKFDYIITNPPYGKEADKFVMQAKKVCRKKFAFLLRTNFLSGETRLNSGIYKGLKNVYIFSRMPDFRSEIRGDGKYKTAMNVYAWMVWEIGYKGKPQINWISNQQYVLKKKEIDNEK